MSASLDRLITVVADTNTVIGSGVVLLGELKAKLDDAIASGNDPVKLQELSDLLEEGKQRLADAIVVNTPAEEPPI